jgi:hypothetical protein
VSWVSNYNQSTIGRERLTETSLISPTKRLYRAAHRGQYTRWGRLNRTSIATLQPITQQTISLFFPYWANSGIARSCATSRPCHRTCLFKCSLVHTYAVALSLPRACIRTFPGQLFMRPSSISSLLYVSVYAERSPVTPTLELRDKLREGRVRVAC